MSKHPESIFSDLTWKDQDGRGGVRNLYDFFYYLLAIHNMPRHADQRTEEQTRIRREAGLMNLQKMYAIEARIKNDDYVTVQERKVWERVTYDIHRETLRARQRAFHTTVIKQTDHPEVLTNHQSRTTDIFRYIEEHHELLKSWSGYPALVLTLKKMGITL